MCTPEEWQPSRGRVPGVTPPSGAPHPVCQELDRQRTDPRRPRTTRPLDTGGEAGTKSLFSPSLLLSPQPGHSSDRVVEEWTTDLCQGSPPVTPTPSPSPTVRGPVSEILRHETRLCGPLGVNPPRLRIVREGRGSDDHRRQGCRRGSKDEEGREESPSTRTLPSKGRGQRVVRRGRRRRGLLHVSGRVPWERTVNGRWNGPVSDRGEWSTRHYGPGRTGTPVDSR